MERNRGNGDSTSCFLLLVYDWWAAADVRWQCTRCSLTCRGYSHFNCHIVILIFHYHNFIMYLYCVHQSWLWWKWFPNLNIFAEEKHTQLHFKVVMNMICAFTFLTFSIICRGRSFGSFTFRKLFLSHHFYFFTKIILGTETYIVLLLPFSQHMGLLRKLQFGEWRPCSSRSSTFSNVGRCLTS